MRTFLPLSLLALPLAAQWINHPTAGAPRTAQGYVDFFAPAPRAADGKPDLSGIWDPDYAAPRVPAGVVIPSSQGPDFSLQFWRPDFAPLPMRAWAEAIFKERDRTFGAGRPSARCLPHAIPDAMLTAHFKIVQTPGLTLILHEEGSRFRQIFTDGRRHPAEMNPAWFGYSIGRWEGDTFVVDTRGFNDLSWLDDAGHAHSEQLHTIERFRRIDFGHMEVEVTIDDPVAYTEPWSLKIPFLLQADTELIENVCDNEKDARHLVGRVPADDEEGVELAPEILARYVGTYSRAGREMEIVLRDGRLVMAGAELAARSETRFFSSWGNLEFKQDEDGNFSILLVSYPMGLQIEFYRYFEVLDAADEEK
jgi:hypothetical protein